MKNKIGMIAAMSSNRGIGFNNTLPWNVPEDMEFFKQHTTGKTVVMGMNTFNSLPFKNGLPKRKNIVVTRQKIESNGEMLVYVSEDEARDMIGNSETDVVVVGGEQIYSMFMDMIDYAIITEINDDELNIELEYFDTFLPPLPESFEVSGVMHSSNKCNIKMYRELEYR